MTQKQTTPLPDGELTNGPVSEWCVRIPSIAIGGQPEPFLVL